MAAMSQEALLALRDDLEKQGRLLELETIQPHTHVYILLLGEGVVTLRTSCTVLRYSRTVTATDVTILVDGGTTHVTLNARNAGFLTPGTMVMTIVVASLDGITVHVDDRSPLARSARPVALAPQ